MLSRSSASTSALSAKMIDTWCEKAMRTNVGIDEFWHMIQHRRVLGI